MNLLTSPVFTIAGACLEGEGSQRHPLILRSASRARVRLVNPKPKWPRLLLVEAPFIAILAATSLVWWVFAALVFAAALSLSLPKLVTLALAGAALVGAVWVAWRMWRALAFRVLDAIFARVDAILQAHEAGDANRP